MLRRLRNHLLTGLACLSFLALSAQASIIDKALTVQVYRLCDNAGTNCASLGPLADQYYEAEVNKVWAQAGIQVSFNFVQNINSTAFSFLDDNVSGDGFADLASLYGAPGASSTSVVDMYLVHTVANSYGEGWLGAGGLVISMDYVLAYSAAGRIDTIAHELGHNLGLVPNSVANADGGGHSTQPNQLMASGGIRTIPTSLADIAPSGTALDYLHSDKIAVARSSSLLHDIVLAPEPATMVLLGFGLLAVGVGTRRKPRR